MFIVNEEGYEFMVFGIDDSIMKEFENWLDKEHLDSNTSISQFNIPKKDGTSKVYIINCDCLKMGSYKIRDFWLSKNIPHSKENIELLFNVVNI